MATEPTPVGFEPYFGGFILETLTIGMYGEARNAIREYIQNGFDSIQRGIDELKIMAPGSGLIQIEMAADRKSLTIRDNGAGLPVKTAAAVLTRVGASGKSHRKNAGFRGIGRLAGIVFSDTVTFTTKVKGEREQTTVVFKAKAMRAAMTPGKGSMKSAQELMRDTVEAFRSPHSDTQGHFFEVKLNGFTDAPDECRSPKELYDFISQVAPVPYPEDFPYRARLKTAEETSDIPIDEVKITIKDGAAKPREVFKRYGSSYEFESGTIELSDCTLHYSPTRRWWAWVGKKDESGAYRDPLVSGLRVRVRNIQIDGAEIIRSIFRTHAKSYVRFQDYYVGEIFVEPSALVPNARRDGFEEDNAWKKVSVELAEGVVKDLGKEAYRVSTQGQFSVDALAANLKTARRDLKALKRANFGDTDKAVELSKRVTTYQKRVAKGSLGADLETAAQLRAIGSEFSDIKQEALSRVAPGAVVDREKIKQDERDDFLREILTLLEDALSPSCFAAAREALLDEYGEE